MDGEDVVGTDDVVGTNGVVEVTGGTVEVVTFVNIVSNL